MSTRPGETFLGYRAKAPLWRAGPEQAWVDPRIEAVVSASDCLAKAPDETNWDMNRAGCLATPEESLAKVPEADRSRWLVVAQWLVLTALDSEEQRILVDADALFPDADLPELPGGEPDVACARLGFDVVAISQGPFGFECAPLTCNGRSEGVAINRFGLVDDVELAVKLTGEFNREQPEPGTYYAVRLALVRVRGSASELPAFGDI